MPKYLVAADGDDMGDAVAEAILQGSEEEAVKLSESIKAAFAAVTKHTKKAGGKVIFEGGDNILIEVNTDNIERFVEECRSLYKEHTDHTLTAGIGSTIKEAHKSLVVGKNTGKNKAVTWSDAVADLYEHVQAVENAKGEAEEEVEEEEGLSVPSKDAQLAEMLYIRLVGCGYGRRQARIMADRYLYAKKGKLPGNSDAEKYLIDGEERWQSFLDSSDKVQDHNTKEKVSVGQKVILGGKLGVIRKVGKANLSVEFMDSTHTTIPFDGDFQLMPTIRRTNG